MSYQEHSAEITVRQLDDHMAGVVITDGTAYSAFRTRYLSFLAAADRGQSSVIEFVGSQCGQEGRKIVAGWVADHIKTYLNGTPVPRGDLASAFGIKVAA